MHLNHTLGSTGSAEHTCFLRKPPVFSSKDVWCPQACCTYTYRIAKSCQISFVTVAFSCIHLSKQKFRKLRTWMYFHARPAAIVCKYMKGKIPQSYLLLLIYLTLSWGLRVVSLLLRERLFLEYSIHLKTSPPLNRVMRSFLMIHFCFH